MTTTPERRMFLMWKSMRGKGRRGYDYRRGEGASPLMMVARSFKVPIRIVREAIEVQRGTDPVPHPHEAGRLSMTATTNQACGWCRDPYCTGDHSADEVRDFGADDLGR